MEIYVYVHDGNLFVLNNRYRAVTVGFSGAYNI